DYFQPGGPVASGQPNAFDDTALPISDVKKLLYRGTSGSDAMNSQVAKLCPQNFIASDPTAPDYAANLKRRQMVTTLSMDLNRLGLAPWLFDRNGSGYDVSRAPNLDGPPSGPATAFPDPLTVRPTTAIPANSDFRTPGQPAT